jgi:hypothetical protein
VLPILVATDLDPKLCAFCEEDDVPSTGKMLFVDEVTDEELFPTKFAACDSCGHAFNRRTAAKNEETGQIACFQFEHFDFQEERVPEFAFYLDSLKCHICEKKAYENSEPLQKIARRLLRVCPDVDTLTTTCGSCAALGLCDECDHD